MEKPSLEEVKGSYKYASRIKDVITGQEVNFFKELLNRISFDVVKGRYFCKWSGPFGTSNFLNLWDADKGYSGITKTCFQEKEASVDCTIEEVVMPNKDEVIGKIPPSRRVTLTDTGAFTGFKLDFNFDQTIEDTLEHLKELLTVKGKEYRRNGNVFHNFEEGAKLTGKIREEVLHGFRLKHEISVNDMRNDLAQESKLPTKEKVEEKYNDILVYYLIEKASMLDRIDNQKEE